jgi:hypothetical protein
LQAGGSTILERTGKKVLDSGSVKITATQGSEKTEKTISVKVFSRTTGNTNQVNANTNTNANVNVSVDPNHLPYVNQQQNIAFSYPLEWGKVETPQYNSLVPVFGKMSYAFFENVGILDRPGAVFVTASSSNYAPTKWTGTPFWFSANISPQLDSEAIIKQIKNAGITAFEVEKVTVDGHAAIKMYSYRGYIHHFLDVGYIIPTTGNDSYSNVLVLRTIEQIAEGTVLEDEAMKKGPDMVKQLKNGTLSEQAMRRYTQLEETVATLHFIQ